MNYAGTNGEDIVTTKTGNVLVPKTPETFTYDADGNMTSDGRFTYTWDAENRMLTAESLTNAPSASRVRVEWTYLPDGRWSQRVASTWNGSSYAAQSTNRIVWDDIVLLAVINGDRQTEQAFLRGVDLGGSDTGAGGVGGLLAISAAINGVHFVLFDGNGNVIALQAVNGSGQTAAYEYGAFGETLRSSGPMAAVNSLRFSTQFTDDFNGLIKYFSREYMSEIGRWASRDIIAEKAGANLMAYVNNSSINKIDPYGQIEFTYLDPAPPPGRPPDPVGTIDITIDSESLCKMNADGKLKFRISVTCVWGNFNQVASRSGHFEIDGVRVDFPRPTSPVDRNSSTIRYEKPLPRCPTGLQTGSGRILTVDHFPARPYMVGRGLTGVTQIFEYRWSYECERNSIDLAAGPTICCFTKRPFRYDVVLLRQDVTGANLPS